MKKLTPAQKETWKPAHLPRHYYPGYVFIPKNGYFQARKVGLTAARVHRDPRFHKTRLLAREFAQLAGYAKLIRTALCTGTTIKCNVHRLHGILNRIVQEDETNICGSRQLLNGNLELLEGFNFNEQALLEDCCTIEADIIEQPDTKQITVHVPSFVPEYYLLPPAGITHARIYIITAILDLHQNTYSTTTGRTTLIPLKRIHFPAKQLLSGRPITGMLNIIALGITWYARQNQHTQLSPSPAPGPLAILSVG